MADIGTVDTSSYQKPAMPVQPLDLATKLGALQQQQLGISQAKLDQANQALGYMTRAMGSIGPNGTKDQYIEVGANAVKMGLVPPDMLETYKQRIIAAPNANAAYKEIMSAVADHTQQLQGYIGPAGSVSNGQQVTPIRTPAYTGAPIPTGAPIQQQAPPAATVMGPGNVPTTIGAQAPQLPPGAAPAGNLPGQYRMPVQPPQAPTAAQPGPVTNPAVPGPSSNFGGTVTGATVGPTTNAATGAPMVPRGFQAGTPPLFEEGKKKITDDQSLAAQRMTAVKPALQALKIMQAPGFPATGPVTGQLNELTAAAKALGIIDTKVLNDPTVLRQEVEKKLAQYVGSSPAGQRSDAAQTLAEAGSPNPKHQILPALIKLTKDSIVLDRVQAARPAAFEGTNYEKYGEHQSKFPQSIDERAFGLDLMPKADATKLTDQMYQKYRKNPSNPEALKFFHSLDIAKKQGFYNNQSDE